MNRPLQIIQPPNPPKRRLTLVKPSFSDLARSIKEVVDHQNELTLFLQQRLNEHTSLLNTGTQGIGPDIASAGTITPSAYLHNVTGTATITTVNLPPQFSGSLLFFSHDGFTLAPGGNIQIAAATKVPAMSMAHLAYHPSDGMLKPLTLGGGPFGATTVTAHGILVGEGANPVVALGPLTNGQLLIGSTGLDPVPAPLTGTANQITITTGAGSITVSLPATITGPTRYTGIVLATATGDALSEGHAIGATTPAAITGTTINGTTISASAAFSLTPVHFAALPGAPTAGMIAAVDNCSTQVWGANADGAGAFKVLVWYNGTNWTVVGK